VAIGLGLKKLLGQRSTAPEVERDLEIEATSSEAEVEPQAAEANFGVFFGLMVWWAFSAILALTIAGERMPWLTYHMAWPMIMLTGWAIGQIIDSVLPRLAFERPQRIGLAILTLIVFVLAAFNTLRALYGATPPFQGSELVQLQATAAFLFPFIAMILSGAFVGYLMKDDLISLGVVALILLAIITLGSTVINGATLLMQMTAGGVDPAILSSDR
jgi:hypothetical protein